MSAPATIDDYITQFPAATKAILESVRSCIHAAAPDAVEAISYGMPTFRINGKNMIHFAGFDRHVGLYATPDGHAQFEPELNRYKRGKGSVQFPLDQPIPYDLIKRITIYRAKTLTEGEN